MVPLQNLQPCEWAEVAEVEGDPSWVARMSALGLRAGARLRMLQPGSPCLFEVGATRLSLRPDTEISILVLPLSTGPARRWSP